MPREIVTVQVGQCGNQLGMKWWDVMLQEQKAHPEYSDARDALFSTVASNRAGVKTLKARCVAVDMEEGVLNSMMRGPLKDLFDSNFFVSDVSGAGNNWAVGHMEYGDRYIDQIADSVRARVEECDCIQSFLIMHSLSGGTGSGLGTRVVGMLEEEFPHVFRISPVVMPASVDDVVTAPYNSCFALKELIEHSDCVLPLDNDALARICDRAAGKKYGAGGSVDGLLPGAPQAPGFNAAQPTRTKLPYDSMNAIVAQMLSNLTCAMRFPGSLNMDINEITNNLVPYPRLHLLTAAIAPLSVQSTSSTGARSVDSLFSSCLEKEHQLVDVSNGRLSAVAPEAGTTLAAAVIARGPQISIGDLTRNVSRLRERMRMVYWNSDGFKTALCDVSPLGHRTSLLLLANNCSIATKVNTIRERFVKLYSVRAHVHHFEHYLDLSYFDNTAETLQTMIDDYGYLNTVQPPENLPQSMEELVYY